MKLRKTSSKSADTLALERDVSDAIGLKVQIDLKGSESGRGTLSIEFKSLDQLDDVLRRLNQGDRPAQSAQTPQSGGTSVPFES